MRGGVTVEIGGIPILLQTERRGFPQPDRAALRRLCESFGRAGLSASQFIFEPPAQPSPEDVQVFRSGSVWRIERGDFCAEFDARSRAGLGASVAESLLASTRCCESFIHWCWPKRAASWCMRRAECGMAAAFVFAGVSGAGKTTMSRLAPPRRHAAYRRDFLHSEERERLSCLWHSFRGRIGPRWAPI